MSSLTLISILILSIISDCLAKPAKRTDGIIDNLKTGYYYIDNGSITAVKPTNPLDATDQAPPVGKRRQDATINRGVDVNQLPSGVKFTPLVRYKQTKTKRKTLFVPNFFG